MNKLVMFVTALAVLAATFAFAVVPVQAEDCATAPGNSCPGLDRYIGNPGRQQSESVGNGNGNNGASGTFGWLGKDHNMAGGADGYQTGLNNSGVAGNRQGNLP